MKLVILGATGRIGRMLRTNFVGIPPDWDVRYQTRSAFVDGRKQEGWFRWPNDTATTNSKRLVQVLEGADCVLNLIGTTPTSAHIGSESKISYSNIELPELIFDAAQEAKVPRLLQASSAAVYGRQKDDKIAIKEDAPLNATSVYGRSKIEMEKKILGKGRVGPRVCMLRIGTIAGADMLLQNAMKAKVSSPLVLDRFASSEGPKRSYIGPSMLSKVIFSLCGSEQELPHTLNVAGNKPVRLDQLLEALKQSGKDVPWIFQQAPSDALERVILDTGSLEKICPANSLAEEPAELVNQAMAYLTDI